MSRPAYLERPAIGPALLLAGAMALILLPAGAALGPGDAGVSLGGLSRTALWAVLWGSATVVAASAATGETLPPQAWAVPALAAALALARMPVALVGLVLLVAIVVPRLSPAPGAAGWARTLVLAAFAAFAVVGADLAGRQHGDDMVADLVVMGFLAAIGMVPFGWQMVTWLRSATPQLGALVAAALLPALVVALVNVEPALAQAGATHRAGFLFGLFGAVTAVAGAVYSMGARDWREVALRTTPCELGLALVGIGAFDLQGLQAAAMTLALVALTRPVMFFADRLGPRHGAGLAATAAALVGAAGLPPTLGFPARQLVLSAATRIHPLVAALVAAGIILQMAALALVVRRRLASPSADPRPAGTLALRLVAVSTGVALVAGGVFPGLVLHFVFRLGAG